MTEKRKVRGDYFVGLDMGTGSVGWAVTDTDYQLQRFKNKDMWGARLFDDASTAAERRTFRTARRRLARRRQRIAWLQEFFAEEVAKTDPLFFLRLNESKYHVEDKNRDLHGDTNTLFADSDLTDAAYHEQFPTIYHLRKYLMETEEKPDIRLVYLALHHILKNRGHFLFADTNMKEIRRFAPLWTRLCLYLEDVYESCPLDTTAGDRIADILLTDDTLRNKKSRLKAFALNGDKQAENMLYTLAGAKMTLAKLFADEELKEAEPKDIQFGRTDYDTERDAYAAALDTRVEMLDLLKAIYDWTVLTRILGDYDYLSSAQVALYEDHRCDLRDLKALLSKYTDKETVRAAFRATDIDGNYPAYVRLSQVGNKKRVITSKLADQEAVNKYFLAIVKDIEPSEEDRARHERITARLEQGQALPKPRSKDNSVIPYQVHLQELRQILSTAGKYYAFLNQEDPQEKEAYNTVAKKIESILTYRIPYYVGPLNPKSEHAWLTRSGEPIRPWNFEDVVSLDESAEGFIRRMTNKCTYLRGEDVVPQESLLFQEYKIYQELNNLRVSGEALSPELKAKIVRELFQTRRNVTFKQLRNLLQAEGLAQAETAVLTGIDTIQGKFIPNYSSYVVLHRIFGDALATDPIRSLAERVILWKGLFGEDRRLFLNKLNADETGSRLSAEQKKQLAGLKFSGWAPFSERFLTGIEGTDRETGEHFTCLLQALRQTGSNLMQLLSSRYTFTDTVREYNAGSEPLRKITYDAVMADVYLSPAVKRSVWQAITIVEEIRKIRKAPPQRIFLEMTRKPEAKKERKDSRRAQLITLYKDLAKTIDEFYKGEAAEHLHALETRHDDRALRQKKLYLYYTQLGRCMYSGEKIDLQTLLEDKSDVYDIDHIYPRSVTKDDSLTNTVLVKKVINLKKGDVYPLPSDIRKDRFAYWSMLKDKGLISDGKFFRLIRKDELTAEELAGFIARQLVETSQMVKATAEILERIYPETTIVYTKASVVSDYRHEYDLLKVRELNDCHHAHDAYLNIVLGNVYYEKFTANPYNFVLAERKKDGKKKGYNLYRFFEKERTNRSGKVIWQPDRHRQLIKDTLALRTALVTVMPVEQRGGFYDMNPLKKGTPKVLTAPLKASDERLTDTSKYGYYNSLTGAYFMAVEHTVKGKRVRTLEPMLLMMDKQATTEEQKERYCEDVLGLIQPKIIVGKIKMKSKILYDGYPLMMKSRTENRMKCVDAQVLYLSDEAGLTLREVVRELNRIQDGGAEEAGSKRISDRDLQQLFDALDKEVHEAFATRPGAVRTIMENGRDRFAELPYKDKLVTLREIVRALSKNSGEGSNLLGIGGKGKSGIMLLSRTLTGHDVILIHESPTGLFTKRQVLSKK